MSVPRYPYALRPIDVVALVQRDDPIILEIGCNDGEDSSKMAAQFPNGKLFCFEPDPRAIQKFKSRVHCPNVTLVEKAIAGHTGQTQFWQSGGIEDKHPGGWDKSGSIHKPTGHLQMSPEINFDSVITVPTITLDEWAGSVGLDRIDLLWMDTQGAEHDVIQGAQETLPKVRFIYSEFYQKPMYQGQRNLDQLLAMLPSFELLAIHEGYNLLAKNKAA